MRKVEQGEILSVGTQLSMNAQKYRGKFSEKIYLHFNL